MSQGKGKGTVEAGKETETSFKILVGGEADDLSEKRDDDSDEGYQNKGNHQTLYQKYPVVGIGGTRIGKEGDAGNECGEDGDAHSPSRYLSAAGKIGTGVFLAMGKVHAHADGGKDGEGDDSPV